jgi:hypothetical protein
VDPAPLCEPWPVSGCAVNWEDYDPLVTGVGVMAASEILWHATGRRFGSCEVSFRPCARRCWEQSYGGWWWYPDRWISGWPYGPVYGGFLAAACGTCTGNCSCTSAAELKLPELAQAVTEVTVDGAVLPASGYVLYDGYKLVRTDGELWPFCQDWATTGGPGVFEVTARFGLPVTALGALAMGEVVPEVLNACKGVACALPSGVLSAQTRQGTTRTFVSPEVLARNRLLGLPVADRFIQAVNPAGLTQGAKIWDPDNMPGHRSGP